MGGEFFSFLLLIHFPFISRYQCTCTYSSYLTLFLLSLLHLLCTLHFFIIIVLTTYVHFVCFEFFYSGDRADIPSITSCYSNWRENEKNWVQMKKEEAENFASKLIAMNLLENENDDNMNEDIEKEKDKEKEIVTDDMISKISNKQIINPINLIPSDCKVANEIIVSLIGGYGELDNIILPADIIPGRYIIEISDKIFSNCLRTPAQNIETENFSDFSENIPLNFSDNFSIPSRLIHAAPLGKKASLEEMKNLFSIVNPIKINRQILFHAVPVGVPTV